MIRRSHEWSVVQAVGLLASAEAIVHDRLADPALLALAPPGCAFYDVRPQTPPAHSTRPPAFTSPIHVCFSRVLSGAFTLSPSATHHEAAALEPCSLPGGRVRRAAAAAAAPPAGRQARRRSGGLYAAGTGCPPVLPAAPVNLDRRREYFTPPIKISPASRE